VESEKNKGQRAEARCPMAYTLPRVLARIKRLLLVERVESEDRRFRSGASTRCIGAKHCIFFRAESLDAGLVGNQRFGQDRIANVQGS